MEYSQPAKYQIIPSGDYLDIVCAKCRSTCAIDYKGLAPSVPLIEITCPKCVSSGEWKLGGAGAGFHV